MAKNLVPKRPENPTGPNGTKSLQQAQVALEKMIPGLKIESSGGAIPFQSWGTLQDRPYYFRYRSGSVSLKVGDVGGDSEEFDLVDDVWYMATTSYGEEYDGHLSPVEFELLMVKLVVNLEPAPFRYEFPGRNVAWTGGGTTGQPLGVEPKDEERIWQAWGYSEEEAYESLQAPSEYLLSHGFTLELQRRGFELSQVNPKPLAQPTKIYPDPPLRFVVLSAP